MTPHAFALAFIKRWEDGNSINPDKTHSLDPVDQGNWQGGASGLGKLVGSNHGVTAAALARHRGVSPYSITREAMRALSLDEAAEIALSLYYHAPGLDRLPWNRVTMSVMDMAWGAGPVTAVKLLQRMIGCADDGQPGPGTAKALAAYVAKHGEEGAAKAYADARLAYYERIIAKRPANAKYRKGWANRTAWLAPNGDGWRLAA